MAWVEGRRGRRGARGFNSSMDGTDACLDVDVGFLFVSIASNDGLGQHRDIHSSVALSCN